MSYGIDIIIMMVLHFNLESSYIDESGINSCLYRDKGYGQKGCKIHAKISGKRFARENFIAAKVGKKIVAPMCYTGSCNTELFIFWLERYLLPSLRPGQVVIMDNASYHKSEKIKKLIKSVKCELLFLPPYSPEFNLIEQFWLRRVQDLGEFKARDSENRSRF